MILCWDIGWQRQEIDPVQPEARREGRREKRDESDGNRDQAQPDDVVDLAVVDRPFREWPPEANWMNSSWRPEGV